MKFKHAIQHVSIFLFETIMLVDKKKYIGLVNIIPRNAL